MEKIFVNGLMAKKPRDQAPDWVKCNISIKREELIAWLGAESKDWINVQSAKAKAASGTLKSTHGSPHQEAMPPSLYLHPGLAVQGPVPHQKT